MNPRNTDTPQPRRARLVSALIAPVLALAAPARAADWYLSVNQSSPDSWNTLSAWKSAADGSGTSPGALSADDTYHINNKVLRSPEGASDATFAGGVLRLSGSAGVLALKTNSPATAIVPVLESAGGKIENYNGGTTRLSVGRLDARSGSTTIASSSGRTVALTITGAFVGPGELRVSGGGSTAKLSVADALAYTGRLRLSGGTLDFDAPWSSSGPLVLEGGVLVLDQPVTVTALTINGTDYPAGTHGAAQFAANGHSSYVTVNGGSITVAPPTTWYLSANQPQFDDWNKLAAWKAAPDGTGASPAVIRAADTFDLNGFDVRNLEGNSTDRFVGAIVSRNSGSDLMVKTTNGGKSSLAKLHAIAPAVNSGGRIIHLSGGTASLRIDTFENDAGSYNVFVDTSNNRTLDLSIGRLLGTGATSFSGGGKFKISIDDANGYTGDLTLGAGSYDFDGDISSAGTLVIGASSQVVLDRALTFTGLTIAGQEYPIDNYSLADLQAAHPGKFTGTSAGSITVRGPVDWYLTTGQVNATDRWDMVEHWNSEPGGGGVSPSAINAIDNYINQTNNRTVRTPEVASTFGGGALVLKSGAKLMLRTPAGAVSSVPTLDVVGGATIYNGHVGIQQILDVNRWTVESGTATLTTNTNGAGGSFDLRVHHLRGAGNITVSGGSGVLLKVNHGAQLTGTFTVNNGATLTLGQTLGLGGSLVVQSGATVALGSHWLYVRGLTVGGVSKAPGIHTVASLGSAFTGTGSVVVYTPASDSPQLFGVNLAGGDFMPNVFWQTDAATWQYYKDKGLTLIRLPFRWHRVQSPLNSTVDFTKLDECLALAAARGMKVILDVHDYGKYGGQDSSPKIGSSSVPISAFVNLWSQIADKYKDNDTVYGYDLMNEPLLDLAVWKDAAQQAVDAIRKKDTRHYILVEGLAYSKATTFGPASTSGNRTLDIRDPIGRLVYSAHSYWDYQEAPPNYASDGNYLSSDAPTPQIGVDHVRPFVEWLKTERPYAFGNVGEFGVPHNFPAHIAGWQTALGNFLQYLRDNGLSATYWAGGSAWGNYQLSCHPTTPGVDKPQMAVLELYNNN
jgi:Endoglucanase